MTFAEIVVFVLLVTVIGFIFSPLQKRLETRIYKMLRNKRSGPGRIVDITDYTKKDKPDGQ